MYMRVSVCLCLSLRLCACLFINLPIFESLTKGFFSLQALSDLLLPGGYLDSQSQSQTKDNSNTSSSSSAGLGMGYYTKLEESGWLRHIRLILKAGTL